MADRDSKLFLTDENGNAINVGNPLPTTGGGGGGTSDVNVAEVAGNTASVNIGTSDAGTQRVVHGSDAAESGTDAVGADTYATILTPSKAFNHILITNQGTEAAIISTDGGTSDNLGRVEGGSIEAYDDYAITTAAIQAKNADAGQNYVNVSVKVW